MRFNSCEDDVMIKSENLFKPTSLESEEYELFSPINPTYEIDNFIEPANCVKCKMQCTGCTGGCTCWGGAVH